MKRIWLLGCCIVVMAHSLEALDHADWSIQKAMWSEHAQTLDLFLRVNPRTQRQVFTNYEDLSVQVNMDSTLLFRIHSIFKGYVSQLPDLSVLPQKILVLVDHGREAQSHVDHFDYIAKRIINEYIQHQVVDLAYFSSETSSVSPIMDGEIDFVSKMLRNEISSSKTSHFAKVFLQLKSQFRNYDRIFLITNGAEKTSTAFRMLNQSWLMDNQIFGNAQIIPVGVGESLVTSFFEFIEDLNTFGIQRNDYSDFPRPNSEDYGPEKESNFLTLRFKLTSHHPWRSKAGNIILSYGKNAQSISTTSKTSVLAHYFNPVLNNQFFTESDPIWTIALTFIVLGLLLYYSIPIYNRYYLKKHHVKVYASSDTTSNHIDPLKLSPIRDDDKVVYFEDQIMLLDSWKFVNKSKEPIESVKHFEHFFTPKITGELFTPRGDRFRFLLPLFLGVTLSGFLTLVNYTFVRNLGLPWLQFERQTSLPHPFSEFGYIHSTVLLLLLVYGIYWLQKYVLTNNWRHTHKDLVSLLALLPGVLIYQTVYGFLYYNLPGIAALAISHLMMGLLITAAIIRPLSISNSANLLTAIGSVSVLSYFSFHLIPGYILSLNVEGSISFMVSSLLFLGVLTLIISRLNYVSIVSASTPQIIDLEKLTSSSETIYLGSKHSAHVTIRTENLDSIELSAAISKIPDGYEIIPEEGPWYVNSERIKNYQKLKNGDRITIEPSSSSEWIVTF